MSKNYKSHQYYVSRPIFLEVFLKHTPHVLYHLLNLNFKTKLAFREMKKANLN